MVPTIWQPSPWVTWSGVEYISSHCGTLSHHWCLLFYGPMIWMILKGPSFKKSSIQLDTLPRWMPLKTGEIDWIYSGWLLVNLFVLNLAWMMAEAHSGSWSSNPRFHHPQSTQYFTPVISPFAKLPTPHSSHLLLWKPESPPAAPSGQWDAPRRNWAEAAGGWMLIPICLEISILYTYMFCTCVLKSINIYIYTYKHIYIYT